MVVIVAGYPDHMDRWLNINPGMRRRFPTTIEFENWKQQRWSTLVIKICKDAKPIGYAFVEEDKCVELLKTSYGVLSTRPGWGNAGDAVIMANKVMGERLLRVAAGGKKALLPTIVYADVHKAANKFEKSRSNRLSRAPFLQIQKCRQDQVQRMLPKSVLQLE
jgi:hypothetical protein